MTDDADDPRPYGRRAFLALLAGGASSFLWAPAASRVLSPLTSGRLPARREPAAGRRLADLHDLGLDAALRPEDLAARDQRARAAPAVASATSSSRAAARPPGLDVPLRHGLDGQERPLVGRAASAPARPRGAAADGPAIRFVSAEEPYNDSLTLEQALLPDVMLGARARRAAAVPAARRAGPDRDPGDVRLQGRQVAERDRAARRASRPGTGKGSATTRTPGSGGRMATAEQLRLPRFTRTERAVHWVHAAAFLVLLGTASASTCRASPRRSAAGRC